MERAGRPTVVVSTDGFEDLAASDARRQGLADARIATVEHPIGGLPDEALDARAIRVVDALIASLSDPGRN